MLFVETLTNFLSSHFLWKDRRPCTDTFDHLLLLAAKEYFDLLQAGSTCTCVHHQKLWDANNSHPTGKRGEHALTHLILLIIFCCERQKSTSSRIYKHLCARPLNSFAETESSRVMSAVNSQQGHFALSCINYVSMWCILLKGKLLCHQGKLKRALMGWLLNNPGIFLKSLMGDWILVWKPI